MNYVDLFSGVGGFHLGLKQAGFKFDKTFHSEIDKYAKQVYKKHFPGSIGIGSITDVRPDELPRIDLCTFGFPCQDLSIAGKRKGIGGARSGLFFEAMRIIRVTRPRYFIFENVKGLFSSNNGEDWLAVLREVADSGYDGQWQLLNTRWFLPQNRERIYFVGHIRGECRPKIFPIGEGNQGNGKDRKKKKGQKHNGNIAWALRSRDYKDGTNFIKQINPAAAHYQDRIYDANGIAPALPTGTGGNHMPFIEQRPRGNNKGGHKKICPTISSNSFEHNNYVRTPLKFLERNQKNIDGDYAFTVDGANTGGVKSNSGIRRLTPVECARLQGFPDDWCGELSDSQAYKCLGNAVSVPVVKAVAERLLND